MDIKGIKDGILISFDDLDWQDAKSLLLEKIQERQDFFQGAQLVLSVGNAVLGTKALNALIKSLSSYEITLHGVLGQSSVTQNATQKLGLITKLEKPVIKQDLKLEPLNTTFEGESAVYVRKTLRSGYKVVYQGHVVIFGDVNPGAEIVASGSVIVWGRLRGTVHAGAEGDPSAVVCALDLSPTQLRIASKIATSPEDHAAPRPEIASIDNDQIIAVPWQH
ncbi:MAG: septum site-determining protein MinC [Brevefilum sp.]